MQNRPPFYVGRRATRALLWVCGINPADVETGSIELQRVGDDAAFVYWTNANGDQMTTTIQYGTETDS